MKLKLEKVLLVTIIIFQTVRQFYSLWIDFETHSQRSDF